MASLKSLLSLAESELGYQEKASNNQLDSKSANVGDKNYTKYARDINAIGLSGCQGQAWCGVYQMWLEYKNSSKEVALSHLGPTFYNCFATMNWAKANKKWVDKTGTPKAGYRVVFSQSHIALVTKVTDKKIYTNEGNTSDGSAVYRDGGRVCNKSYDRTFDKILGYVIVNYEDSHSAEIQNMYEIALSYEGLKTTTSSTLNIRNHAKSGSIVGTYSGGAIVLPTYKCFVDGEAWFQTDKGWISGKYVEGWIQELSDASRRWWYVKPGYKYAASEWMEYKGKWYYLDKDGWMVTDAYVASLDGSKKGIYYWVDANGVWEGKDVKNPDLKKYRLAK